MKTKNHNSKNFIYQLFILFLTMLLTFSGNAQCDLEGNVMVYEFEMHEKIYYKVPKDFDYKSQIQLDLLKIREKSRKTQRKITIDKDYQMTDQFWVLGTENHYEPKEVQHLESVYTEKGQTIFTGFPGSKNTSKVIKNKYVYDTGRNSNFKEEFYTSKVSYLNGYFGWPQLDDNYFQIIQNKGFMIQNIEGVTIATKDQEKIIYDPINLFYFREYYNQGTKHTITLKYFEFEGVKIPSLKKITESTYLYNGDCVDKVIEYRYPEDKVSFCLSEPLVSPRNLISESQSKLNFYPNPVFDELTITNPNPNESLKVAVFDLKGTMILNEELNAGSQHLVINTSNLPTGMYLARATFGAQTESFKFIKN